MPAETHVSRVPLGPDDVLATIRANAADVLGVDEDAITRESRFVADLGADSVALMELVDAIEEELGERSVGFTIDDDDLAELHTVGDAVDYVLARLERIRS